MDPRVRQAGLLLLLLLLQRGGRLVDLLAGVAVSPSPAAAGAAAAARALITAAVRQETLVHLKRDGEREC